jgi:hypothetical protein
MIRWIQTRLVIEKPDTHYKYYPQVVSARTQKSAPFSISYAEIEIISNVSGSTSTSVSQVRFNDIVRLQVSIKMNPNEKTVWQDLFSGRIVDSYAKYGSMTDDMVLYCQGHEAEAETALIEETYSYSSSTDVTAVFSYFSKYLSNLTFSADYADTGILFPTYDSTANQTYISDLFSDAEKVSGYDWIVKAIPVYSNKNLSAVYIGWNQFSQTVTNKYKIIEGTSRVLSTDFSVEGKGVRTAYRVEGDECTGYDFDPALTALYGTRTDVTNQSWVKSEDLAESIAEGVLDEIKTPKVSGQVTLIGTPDAEIGDLVYCKCPSQELNGSSVEDNFSVYRVEHTILGNEFLTTLDLDKVRKTEYDFYADNVKNVKTCMKNQVN